MNHVYDIEKTPISYAENTYKAASLFDPGYHVAIKVFNKSNLDDKKLMDMKTEISTLCTLDHPKIIKYLETYDDTMFTYLVMEYVEGIPLYEKIALQEN